MIRAIQYVQLSRRGVGEISIKHYILSRPFFGFWGRPQYLVWFRIESSNAKSTDGLPRLIFSNLNLSQNFPTNVFQQQSNDYRKRWGGVGNAQTNQTNKRQTIINGDIAKALWGHSWISQIAITKQRTSTSKSTPFFRKLIQIRSWMLRWRSEGHFGHKMGLRHKNHRTKGSWKSPRGITGRQNH